MISSLSVFNIICQRGGKILCSTYNGLIAVLSCEIYVGWVTFEREMYTEFIDARNRLDEETDRFSDLPKATNVAGQLQCTTHNHAVASGFTATL